MHPDAAPYLGKFSGGNGAAVPGRSMPWPVTDATSQEAPVGQLAAETMNRGGRAAAPLTTANSEAQTSKVAAPGSPVAAAPAAPAVQDQAQPPPNAPGSGTGASADAQTQGGGVSSAAAPTIATANEAPAAGLTGATKTS